MNKDKDGKNRASTEVRIEENQMREKEENWSARFPSTGRTWRINPLGMRVVVKIRKEDDKTASGLFLPEGSKRDQQESLLGEVIEVATAEEEDFEEDANISGVPLGAFVLIPKDAGVRIPWDDNLRIVETADILAILDEVNVV